MTGDQLRLVYRLVGTVREGVRLSASLKPAPSNRARRLGGLQAALVAARRLVAVLEQLEANERRGQPRQGGDGHG